MVAMAELVAILHHGLTQGAQVLSGPQHKAITLKKIPCQPIFLTRSTLAPSSTGLALTYVLLTQTAWRYCVESRPSGHHVLNRGVQNPRQWRMRLPQGGIGELHGIRATYLIRTFQFTAPLLFHTSASSMPSRVSKTSTRFCELAWSNVFLNQLELQRHPGKDPVYDNYRSFRRESSYLNSRNWHDQQGCIHRGHPITFGIMHTKPGPEFWLALPRGHDRMIPPRVSLINRVVEIGAAEAGSEAGRMRNCQRLAARFSIKLLLRLTGNGMNSVINPINGTSKAMVTISTGAALSAPKYLNSQFMRPRVSHPPRRPGSSEVRLTGSSEVHRWDTGKWGENVKKNVDLASIIMAPETRRSKRLRYVHLGAFQARLRANQRMIRVVERRKAYEKSLGWEILINTTVSIFLSCIIISPLHIATFNTAFDPFEHKILMIFFIIRFDCPNVNRAISCIHKLSLHENEFFSICHICGFVSCEHYITGWKADYVVSKTQLNNSGNPNCLSPTYLLWVAHSLFNIGKAGHGQHSEKAKKDLILNGGGSSVPFNMTKRRLKCPLGRCWFKRKGSDFELVKGGAQSISTRITASNHFSNMWVQWTLSLALLKTSFQKGGWTCQLDTPAGWFIGHTCLKNQTCNWMCSITLCFPQVNEGGIPLATSATKIP
ncbi:putative signal peptide protein [Puccinia sorghi]|uniref:Putative signal peptide protein n=1 Tax=Puccinia sorghi TaxID=27349 RepID=A0A0L6VM13_9BASI|nr:putative signal peptide protein [Puccinia sorghi]